MDFDIVSDLNGGDEVISANAGDVSGHGADTVNMNGVREGTKPAIKVDTPVADDKAAKPLSLRDQISSSLKGETDTPPVASQDGGPVRNPDGTFAPKTAAEPTGAAGNAGEPPAAPVAVPAPQGIDPQVFASLPAETQAQLARTMEDVGQRQQRFAVLEPIEQLIAPRLDAWALNGMQPAQALHQLLALSDFAGRDPKGFIQYIAQNNGVDLEELVFEAEPVDPQYKALQDEINALKGQVQGQTRQQQQAAHESVVNNVVAFAAEKGQDGQPLRPYFEELGAEVLPYIEVVKQANPSWPHDKVLQEAYDRACWATPSVRNKMQAASNAAAEAERLRQQAARAEAARTASASVRSGAPTSAPTPPNDASRSLRDTIRESMAAHG